MKLTGQVAGFDLLTNGDFEDAASDGRITAGWKTPLPRELTKGHSIRAAVKHKKSGRYALEIVQKGKFNPKKSPTSAFYPAFAVDPGRKYKLSTWIKRTQGDSYNEIKMFWLTADRKYMGNLFLEAYTKGAHDWRYVESTAVAPTDARFAMLRVFIWPDAAAGTVYFDDIRVVPLTATGHPPPEVKIGPIEKRP